MSHVLIVYQSFHGRTYEIACHIRQRLHSAGAEVSVLSIHDAASIGLSRFDAVIIGAAIRYGKHGDETRRFIDRHCQYLKDHACGFYSVSALARKPDRGAADSNPYVKRFLQQIDWQPACVGVFAGRLRYHAMTLSQRWMIRCIMWLANGPLVDGEAADFTDWAAVDRFIDHYSTCLAR